MTLLPFTPPVVKHLMKYVVVDDSSKDWAERAIKSLVRKLKKSQAHQLKELDKAVTTKGQQPTGCILIPRSLDGRLQIAHKKVIPHVAYCRIWRWPNLLYPQELKAIETCEYAFHLKRDDTCVNPYHYCKIEQQGVYIYNSPA